MSSPPRPTPATLSRGTSSVNELIASVLRPPLCSLFHSFRSFFGPPAGSKLLSRHALARLSARHSNKSPITTMYSCLSHHIDTNTNVTSARTRSASEGGESLGTPSLALRVRGERLLINPPGFSTPPRGQIPSSKSQISNPSTRPYQADPGRQRPPRDIIHLSIQS